MSDEFKSAHATHCWGGAGHKTGQNNNKKKKRMNTAIILKEKRNSPLLVPPPPFCVVGSQPNSSWSLSGRSMQDLVTHSLSLALMN